MDFLALAKDRYSVRKFTDKKVEKEKIDSILEVARLAPTACNLQPERLLVLDTEGSLNKLKECTPFHFDAPFAIIVCYDKNECWKRKYDGKESGEVDASIVATHMMLEIANLGLGSTWVGSFNPQKLIEMFNIPENIIPVAVLPIGYPAEDSTPYPGHEASLSKDKIVFYNSF